MISINIDKSKQLPGITNAFIKLEEYKEDVIDYLRKLSSRKYDNDTKTWEISLYDLDKFITNNSQYEMKITYFKEKACHTDIPGDYCFKTIPYSYQKDGIEYGLNHDIFILGDEMGLGKTKQIIDLAGIRHHLGLVDHCLIICGVNSVKLNWEAEVHTHSHLSCKILGMRTRKNGNRYLGSTADKIQDIKTCKEFFLITNIETLREDKFIEALLKRKDIQMVAIDEFHKANNTTSAQGHNLQKLKSFKYKVAMSGTPVLNNPLDSYGALKWLGLENSNLSTFKKFYCEYGGYNNTNLCGYKNLNRLKDSISHAMLRRLKADVLDLPEKIEQIEYVEMKSDQTKIYNEARDHVLENIDLIVNSFNPLSQLLRLRQATGYTGILSSTVQQSCKLDRVENIIEELISNNKKCIVYSNWTSITDEAIKRLSRFNPAVITGSVSGVERQEQVKKFQTDDTCKICIGTIGACGTGITLTAATTVIFLDLPWTFGDYQQACDRAHRVGQKNTVHIIKMIVPNTIDERIHDIVYRKGAMSDFLIDGKITSISKQMIMQLLN